MELGPLEDLSELAIVEACGGIAEKAFHATSLVSLIAMASFKQTLRQTHSCYGPSPTSFQL